MNCGWGVGYVGPITDKLWVVSRLSMYRGLLIDSTVVGC